MFRNRLVFAPAELQVLILCCCRIVAEDQVLQSVGNSLLVSLECCDKIDRQEFVDEDGVDDERSSGRVCVCVRYPNIITRSSTVPSS